MSLRSRIILLLVMPILVISFQNCGGNMTPLASNKWGSGNTYLDGLPAGITQPGKIFSRDPASDSGNQALALNANTNSYAVDTEIKHLLNLNYLSNSYIHVNQDTFYPSNMASPQGSLAFTPFDREFQQVNAYFHIDQLMADLFGMSMFPVSYASLYIDAHCGGTYAVDNAYFAYDSRKLCMGYTDVPDGGGTKRLWSADDKDVLIHEFGHSLNHAYSSTDILTSTSDLGAIDEGFADLWAYRQTLDPKISVWFGRAILENAGFSEPSLRNLTEVYTYPQHLVDEIHYDAIFMSGAVYAVQAATSMTTQQKTRLEKRMLESLQIGHGFQDAIMALRDETLAMGVNASTVTTALTNRGLYRRDLASEVSLDGTNPTYVIDNHEFSFQDNGNCNGALDAGETVLIFPNLRNGGSIKGGVQVELSTSTPTRATVISGGDYGFFYRLNANTTYLAAEMNLSHSNDTYLSRLARASFAVQVPASATAGNANFTMTVTTMDTIDGTPDVKTINFTLPVGTVPNQSSCATDVFP